MFEEKEVELVRGILLGFLLCQLVFDVSRLKRFVELEEVHPLSQLLSRLRTQSKCHFLRLISLILSLNYCL